MSLVSSAFRVVENPEPRAWEEFVCGRGGHLLQSCAWAELKARVGWTVTRIAVEHAGTWLGGAQILFRSLPLGLKLAYVPRGPIVDPQDQDGLAALLESVRAAARSQGAFLLKIEPNWLDDPVLTAWLTSNHWRVGPAVQPRTTIHVDMTRDLPTILAQMKPKWRYNIRLAERKGIKVREGSPADLPSFYRLMRTTGARDKFAIHSEDYYGVAIKEMVPGLARFLVAEYEGEMLAAILVTALGEEAIYLYGASGNAHRERMPNHALHWAAIQWAKARGCARYDLWGIADVADVGTQYLKEEKSPAAGLESRPSSIEANSDHSPLPHGLYQFKRGFGGKVVQYIGGFDTVFSRARFELYERALAARHRFG